ncbi:hypothetical protein DM02DRAFT_395644 [Periconia macrospinosa]|uniref:Uncharacterized protein n=1 Tax=Periconia macrospinosa TaxID=97972 RepID=A0A2V1CYU5_9PLEO|nr:hypothetical protein DM02DRAFT_395644 [Periconia macrospinosa]
MHLQHGAVVCNKLRLEIRTPTLAGVPENPRLFFQSCAFLSQQDMVTTRYGTIYERYLGTAVAVLSHLRGHQKHPVAYLRKANGINGLDKRKKDLESLLEHQKCEPWRPENHMTVEISNNQWENRSVLRTLQLEDGRSYEVVEFPKMEEERRTAHLNVLNGVARFEVASSDFKPIVDFFARYELQPWWVADFFAHSDEAPRQPPAFCTFTASQNKDKDLATKVVPLEAFEPLLSFEVFRTPSYASAFSSIRQSKCKEVACPLPSASAMSANEAIGG